MRLTLWSGDAERRNIAVLGAFCLFLSTIEYLIPKPLPFMRIGLANLPLMLALDLFPSPAPFALLALLKLTGQALISGTLFSYVFLFSAAGTAASAPLMYLLRRVLGRRIGFIGIGVSGAVASNAAQMLLARAFLFGESARFLAPIFLGMGLLSGAALGVCCALFASRSLWYRRFTADAPRP
jgi:heptaprenyl diphosphate synthase